MLNLFSGFILFQNSAYIPLLLLTAVPLLLHLFSKIKPPKLIFSSNELLRKILKQNERIKKPHDILLLIIRTLIFFFIILIFLKPLYFNQSPGINFFKPRSIVIIVDASASMAYNSNGQTTFAAACAEATHILSGLSSKDKANIIFLKSSPESLFPTTATNFAFLKEKLNNAAVSNEAGAVRPAIKKAIEILQKEKDRRAEILVISDFQKTQWNNFFKNPDIPGNISFTFIKTETVTSGNYAISSSDARPYTPLPGDNIIFSCEISNYSSRPKKIPVYFQTGAIYKREKVSISPWNSSEISFSIPYSDNAKSNQSSFSKADYYSYIFSLDEDSFPGDNIRYGVIKTGKNLKVSLINTANSNSQLKKALNSLTFLDVQNCELNETLLNEIPDFLFIEKWHGEQTALIKKLSKLGTALFIFLAPGIKTSAINQVAGKIFSTNNNIQLTQQNAEKKAFKLRLVSPDDKVFKLFANGEYGDPADAIVKKRLLIPQVNSNATVLFDYSDKVPALIRISNSNNPPVYIWNIPMNRKNSNFVNKIQFIPILGELILSARTKNKNLTHLLNYTPGTYLTFSSENINNFSRKIILKNQKQSTFKIKSYNENGKNILITDKPVTDSGIYSWLLKNKVIMINQVNFPASESDLRTIPTDKINKLGTTVNAGSGAMDTLHSGYNLFPILFILAILAILTEGLVMVRSEYLSSKLNRNKE